MKTLTHAALLALVLPLLTAGCTAAKASEELPPPSGPAAAAPPDLETLVERDTPTASPITALTIQGTTYPSEQAALAPKATGILSSVLVDEGERVKKGQALFRLESTEASLRVRQARAAVTAAKVQLRMTLLDYERALRLYQSGAISQAELDRANAARDAAEASVAQGEAALALARHALNDTAVVAPWAGVVTAVHAHQGETVTMMPPTIVLEMQQLDPLEVRATLPENGLRNVKPGDAVKVRFTALGVSRETTVQRLAPTVDKRSRTVEVVALVDNPDNQLRSGMLVEVEFAEASAQLSSKEKVR